VYSIFLAKSVGLIKFNKQKIIIGFGNQVLVPTQKRALSPLFAVAIAESATAL
jgi:hypothetical protein